MKSGIKKCIKSYASKTGCPLDVADTVMRTALEVIKDEIINSGGVSFIGDFSIEVVNRSERSSIHPITGVTYTIPAYNTLKITVGKHLKEKINK